MGAKHAKEQLIYTGLNEDEDRFVMLLYGDFGNIWQGSEFNGISPWGGLEKFSINELMRLQHIFSENSVTTESDDRILDDFFALCASSYGDAEFFDNRYRAFKATAVKEACSRVKVIAALKSHVLEKPLNFDYFNDDNALIRSLNKEEMIKVCRRSGYLTSGRLGIVLSVLPLNEWENFLKDIDIYEKLESIFTRPFHGHLYLDIFKETPMSKWHEILSLPNAFNIIYKTSLEANNLIFAVNRGYEYKIDKSVLLALPPVSKALGEIISKDNFEKFYTDLGPETLLLHPNVIEQYERLFADETLLFIALSKLQQGFIKFITNPVIAKIIGNIAVSGKQLKLLQSVSDSMRYHFIDHNQVSMLYQLNIHLLLDYLNALPTGHRVHLLLHWNVKVNAYWIIYTSISKLTNILNTLPKSDWQKFEDSRYLNEMSILPIAKQAADVFIQHGSNASVKFLLTLFVNDLKTSRTSMVIYDGDDINDLTMYSYILTELPTDLWPVFWGLHPTISTKIYDLIETNTDFLKFLHTLPLDKRWELIAKRGELKRRFVAVIAHGEPELFFAELVISSSSYDTRVEILQAVHEGYRQRDELPQQSSAEYSGLNSRKRPAEEDRNFLKALEQAIIVDENKYLPYY